MPKFDATPTYGASIPVESGDIIQNTGKHMILVCAPTPAADGDAVELLPGRGITITAATQIRVRCASRHGSNFKVIEGL